MVFNIGTMSLLLIFVLGLIGFLFPIKVLNAVNYIFKEPFVTEKDKEQISIVRMTGALVMIFTYQGFFIR